MPDIIPKPTPMPSWQRQLPGAALLAATLLLTGAGCGQKGPLYLPQADGQGTADCPDSRCQAQAPQAAQQTKAPADTQRKQ